jgi:chromate transporter
MPSDRKEDSEVETIVSEVPFGQAVRFWVKLGFISFGGPAGQIAIMHKELVEKRKWISEDKFLHALNFCMLLPGPEAQQLATYNGWRLHGIKGGIVAGAFFVLPSVFFLLALSYVYARWGNVGGVAAVLNGFKPVVVAIVVEAVLKIGKRSLQTKVHVLIAGLSFVALQFFGVQFPLIVIGALIFGLIWSRDEVSESEKAEPELVHTSRYRLLKIAVACGTLWVVPFILVVMIFGSDNVAAKLYLFFTQAAFVTFGGAYAVLAYVNQAAVAAGWITSVQAVDGLALAETTPGPLIMVLQFIGFMTGWQNSGNYDPTMFAVICALLVTFVTFLPSFLFVFAGAPYIDKLHANKRLSGSLAFVTASVVGVVLNLSLVFGATVVLHEGRFDPFSASLAVAAFAALYFFKQDVLVVIAAGGIIGLIRFFLFGV